MIIDRAFDYDPPAELDPDWEQKAIRHLKAACRAAMAGGSSPYDFLGLVQWVWADCAHADPKPGQHGVYRLWTHGDKLLYIGVTSNFPRRIARHKRRWGDQIAEVTWEEFPTRSEAEAAEIRAIRDERPLANIQR